MKVKIDPALLGGHSIIIRHMVKGVDCPLAAIDPDDSPIEVCGGALASKGEAVLPHSGGGTAGYRCEFRRHHQRRI